MKKEIYLKLTKEELGYLWGFVMAMINNNIEQAKQDTDLLLVLKKTKKQFPWLRTLEWLREDLEAGFDK